LLFGTNLTVPFGFKSVSGLMGFFLKIFISSLDKLLLDFRLQPKRYIGISVFGKKNTPPSN
jgi:hypothetical protein